MAAEKERNPGSSSAEIGKYLDILARDPNSRVFAPLAEAYRKAGHLDDAVETALEGLKVHPNYLGGRVALGRAYFEKKQFAEAAAEMQKVAKAAPDNIIAHRVLGQIADSRNDLPAAERSFRMVLLLDPRDLEAQQFLKSLAGAAPAAPALAAVAQPAARPVTPPSVPAPPAPPPPVSLPVDEIQGIEDLELQLDEIVIPLDSPRPPVVVPLEQFAEEPLDIAPDSWLPEPQAPAVPVPALQAAPTPKPPPVAAEPEVSPFGEIDLESVAHEPVPDAAADAASDSLFEVFTRMPGTTAAPVPVKDERGGKTGARELEIETTAYTPSEIFDPAGVAPPLLLSLDEELPRIDLAEELRADSHVAEYEAVDEVDEEILDEEEPPDDGAGRGVFDTETLASIYTKQGFYGRAAEIYRRLIAQRPDDAGLREKLEGVLVLERGPAGSAAPVAALEETPEPFAAIEERTESIAEPVAAAAEIDDFFESIEEPVAEVAAADGEFSSPALVAFAAAAATPAAAVRPGPGPELLISHLQTLLEAFKEGRPR